MKKLKYRAGGALLLLMMSTVFTGCVIEVNEENPTLLFLFDDSDFITDQGLEDYGYGLSFGFSVFDNGSGSLTDDGLAWGSGIIKEDGTTDLDEGGDMAPRAQIWDTRIAWNPVVGEDYDVYLYLDMNGSGEFEEWYDYEYDGHLDITINEPGENTVTIPKDKFFYKTQPPSAGVYSETYPVKFEPTWRADDPIPIDLGNTEKTPYDGSYVLKVVFEDATNWLHAMYDPPTMDVSESAKIVIYIENSAADFDHISLIVSDTLDDDESGVDIGPGVNPAYRTAGVGPGGNWDEYTVPFTDLTGLDPAKLYKVTFGFPKTTGDAEYTNALYFDNIHFAP